MIGTSSYLLGEMIVRFMVYGGVVDLLVPLCITRQGCWKYKCQDILNKLQISCW